MTEFWWPVIARRRAVGPTEELKIWAAEITTITGQPWANSLPKKSMMSGARGTVTRKNARAPVEARGQGREDAAEGDQDERRERRRAGSGAVDTDGRHGFEDAEDDDGGPQVRVLGHVRNDHWRRDCGELPAFVPGLAGQQPGEHPRQAGQRERRAEGHREHVSGHRPEYLDAKEIEEDEERQVGKGPGDLTHEGRVLQGPEALGHPKRHAHER